MTASDTPSCRPAVELDNRTLVEVLEQVYARLCIYDTEVLHIRWRELNAEINNRLEKVTACQAELAEVNRIIEECKQGKTWKPHTQQYRIR